MHIVIPLVTLLFATAVGAATDPATSVVGRVAEVAFTATEKTLIEEFFGRQAVDDPDAGDATGDGKVARGEKGGKSKKMPPGLAKRDSLPPGLQKQLERNGTLPPGLAKRDLPPDLAQRLPERGDGTERAIVDADVVLIETATGVVLDILRGVAGTGN